MHKSLVAVSGLVVALGIGQLGSTTDAKIGERVPLTPQRGTTLEHLTPDVLRTLEERGKVIQNPEMYRGVRLNKLYGVTVTESPTALVRDPSTGKMYIGFLGSNETFYTTDGSIGHAMRKGNLVDLLPYRNPNGNIVYVKLVHPTSGPFF